ncbi:hypothetical protein, partial [Leuconostoc lactis]
DFYLENPEEKHLRADLVDDKLVISALTDNDVVNEDEELREASDAEADKGEANKGEARKGKDHKGKSDKKK